MNHKRSIRVVFHAVLLVAFTLVYMGCKATKNVPEGKHLLVENTIQISDDQLLESEISAVIRQNPNLKFARIAKLRLMAFNAVDSAKVARNKEDLRQRLIRINTRRLMKMNRINGRRIAKAKQKGLSFYKEKRVSLKDTVDFRTKIREKLKYKFGEAPVIADTFFLHKSVNQITSYLRAKGYYYGSVNARFDTLVKKKNGKLIDRKKVKAFYAINTGERYFIDSVVLDCANEKVRGQFLRYIQKVEDKSGLNFALNEALNNHHVVSIPFDANQLDNYRYELSKYMRDRTFYGFSEKEIGYVVDTFPEKMTMSLKISITDRMIQNAYFKDSLDAIPHQETRISAVYFHICDTTLFTQSFKTTVEERGLNLTANNFLITLDTLLFKELKRKVEVPIGQRTKQDVAEYYKSAVFRGLLGNPKDSITFDPLRIATFMYNGELFVHPELIEAQNYLENGNYYKEYYLDRTYTRLVQLGLFSTIRPDIIEIDPVKGLIEVHYYLIPATKQAFSFEPRANNYNGYLGVSASLNYSNKNVFKTGTNMVFSFSGGFESTPPVFQKDTNGVEVNNQQQSFNTFEVGPSLKFDIPGLFPLGVTVLGKRQRPRTVISGAMNYQHRTDFDRKVFQFNYLYKFAIGDGKTQTVSFGLPAMSVVKLVDIRKFNDFEAKINALNDLFLKNAYNNQLIWEDFRIQFDYDNLESEHEIIPKNVRLTFNSTFNTAGNLLGLITGFGTQKDSVSRTFLGVKYSQFTLLDTKLIANVTFKKHRSLAFRLMGGYGLPGRNSLTSLPYDYSFFSGGANENRGWVARTLGPGAYSSLLDSNNVSTQIGDIRFSSSIEYRFGSGGLFNHAFFMDAGNIWTQKNDVNRPGGQFSKDWYKELGIAIGYGLRLNLEYFIFRIDIGAPIHNPALPIGSRWFFQERTAFNTAASNYYGTGWESRVPSKLFNWQLHFGIGFPF